MRMTIRQQALHAGDPERGQDGVEPKGGAPTSADLTAEFAAEPGFRPGGGRSGNQRVHKS
ncbi:hypothetical protein [Paenibacillus sp.]|uniref:hypothetical protein n=1 Tax=Paenibacillus sp. TaxID=58172 RepID=UPI002810E1CE|nr:hypothetical protein [Paenibacillus sp.]